VTAIRIGTIDLAIGNVFGSNIFNICIFAYLHICILALDDILYTKGPLLLNTSPNHIIPVLGTIIITAIGITGIAYRQKKMEIGFGYGIYIDCVRADDVPIVP
jgi:cation:H+ antiporter